LGVAYPSEELGIKLPPPRVTILLIIVNAAAYILTSLDRGLIQISERWLYWGAFIPVYLTTPAQLYRLITSMFLHANLFHIFFNMLYLYFFGKSVESVMGGRRYLALYLASGIAAEVFHTSFIPVEGPLSAVTPAVGASGAISGVLGAYLLLFPGSRLTMCFFYFYFPVCVTLNAAAYLIFWFATQVLQGYMGASLGVAVFAHAGGFLAGMALLPFLLDKERHRLFRALTASRRAFKHIYFGTAGLGPFSKFILTLLIIAVVAGGAYSAIAARSLATPIKVLYFRVSYEMYCQPGGYLCGSAVDEEPVVLRVDKGLEPLSPISSNGVRVVYNRLTAAGVLYDKERAGTSATVRRRGLVEVMGVGVRLDLNMDARYDERGVVDSAKGELRTDVLTCIGARCVIGGVGDYRFSITPLYRGEEGGALASIITLLSLLSMATCALALDNVLRKASKLEIVA